MIAGDVALLGVGSWGRHHCRVLREMGRLRRVWDPDAMALARHTEPSERAQGLEHLLADPGVRAVVVATPARSHFELASLALEQGKDVLVEKPLTLLEAEGEILVRRASALGRILMVGHITLFHPAIQRLMDLVAQGELGRLRYLYANRLNLGTVREEEDILWSFAPHDVAVFLELVGEWPESVAAFGGTYLREGRADVTVTHLHFRDGVRAHIFVSWLHPTKEHRLVVMGDRRMATFADGPGGGELVLSEGVPPEAGGTSPPPLRRNRIEVEPHEPLRQELEHFLLRCADRARPLTCGVHGLRVLRILETARRSLDQNGAALPCGERPLEFAT
jgi:UDP-2-acetamido-3-amino-2,3-dideoxy-glucuronate N-acetyltransferase